jgi:hypothetical protein
LAKLAFRQLRSSCKKSGVRVLAFSCTRIFWLKAASSAGRKTGIAPQGGDAHFLQRGRGHCRQRL